MTKEFEWTPALRNAYRLLTKSIREKRIDIRNAYQITSNEKLTKSPSNEIEDSKTFLNELLDGNSDEDVEMRVQKTLKRLESELNQYAFPGLKEIMELTETAMTLVNIDPTLGQFVQKVIDLRSSDEKFGVNRKKVLSSYPPTQEPIFEPNLTYPWVKYPHSGSIVCAFAKSSEGPFFACRCAVIPLNNMKTLKQRQYIRVSELFLKSYEKNYREEGNLVSDTWNRSVNEIFWYDAERSELDLGEFSFVDEICHKCIGVLPTKYSPNETPWEIYIRQEYLRFGLLEGSFYGDFLEDQLNQNLKDLMKKGLDAQSAYEVFHKRTTSIMRANPTEEWAEEKYWLEYQRTQVEGQIRTYFESNIRRSFALDELVRGSRQEELLYLLLERIYRGKELKRQVRPPWLKGLELDIWIPELSIAFEYQGKQHFQPIAHWGGDEALMKIKERDKTKSELCQEKGIKLICINYDDPVEEHFVLELIRTSI